MFNLIVLLILYFHTVIRQNKNEPYEPQPYSKLQLRGMHTSIKLLNFPKVKTLQCMRPSIKS